MSRTGEEQEELLMGGTLFNDWLHQLASPEGIEHMKQQSSSCLFVNEELSKHLCRTVLEPSGVPDTSYISAPALTTFRVVGPDSTDVLATDSAVIRTMQPEGLPEAYLYKTPTAENSNKDEQGTALSELSKLGPFSVALIVDSGCAEAVLRGSDVFAPGVVASCGPKYRAGDKCLIVCAPSVCRENKSKFKRLADVKNNSLLSDCQGLVVIGAGVLKMSRAELIGVPQDEGSNEVTATRSGDRSTSSEKKKKAKPKPWEVPLKPAKGIACVNLWNPSGQISRTALTGVVKRSCNGCEELQETDLFLQNFSSMVPVALVMEAARASFPSSSCTSSPSLSVLDMCAAPGGKSSHILKKAMEFGLVGESTEKFQLTCCERSSSRCKQLEGVLRNHVGSTIIQQHVQCKAMDANRLAKEEPSVPCSFDVIVVDPPCTGLGLRPRLRPHEHSVQDVVASADYQRKLFDTAFKLAKVGGLIAYSTCTISIEEDEHTVAWALRQFEGSLELVTVPSCGDGHHQPPLNKLLSLAPPQSWIDCPELHDVGIDKKVQQQQALAPLLMRFNPVVDTSMQYLDGVGFFVAIFRKIGTAIDEDAPVGGVGTPAEEK